MKKNLKNIIYGVIIVILILTFIIGVPFALDKSFDYTHKKEIYKSLECLDEYNFNEETKTEFIELIEKVANDKQYSILIEYEPNGVAVSIRRSGEYSCNYTKYFYE